MTEGNLKFTHFGRFFMMYLTFKNNKHSTLEQKITSIKLQGRMLSNNAIKLVEIIQVSGIFGGVESIFTDYIFLLIFCMEHEDVHCLHKEEVSSFQSQKSCAKVVSCFIIYLT